MFESLNTRIATVAAVFLMAAVWVAPNFVNFGESWWFTKDKIVYGLDIQGGLHLVMGVGTEEVVVENSKRLAISIKKYLDENDAAIKSVEIVNAAVGEMKVQLKSPADKDKVSAAIQKQFERTLQVLEENDEFIVVRYYDAELRFRKGRIVQQAIETLRNRIDEFGVAEPSITAQGADRILVQLPGIKDAERAKELINKTARLDFMLFHEEYDPEKIEEWVRGATAKGGYSLGNMTYTKYVKRLNEDLKDKLPENSIILFQKAENARTLEKGAIGYLLRSDTNLGGDELKDASVTQDQYGAWEVSINFTPQGGAKFADLTGANVGKQMAVVLDKVIKSVPNIRERIPNGSGVISMGTGNSQEILEEAQLVATALRAGSLPATLEQLEERTVGPSLGADSIAQGKKAGMVGGILVLIFMLVYYRVSGLVANMALLFNILIVLAVLTSLGATLTLPGVAGIILTIGMAVDANVIIFERIKEELAKGASMSLSVKEGYSRAFSAIFDANITTAAVCIVLIYFGTGPVRGFAVTLMIGIGASMFTAIFVTRTVFEFLINRVKMQKISI